ncbi:MAG TPA: PqiC family protein [Candidatus Binatia bacterium]|nr:PqiC family protein [Candidatus Binatia bacterium]
MSRISKPIAAVFLLATLLATGCATSKPARFYVLSALTASASQPAPDGPAIGVGPVIIPQYLDRPEIVTRSQGNRLELGEFDQWGGRIGDNIVRVMADNLAGLLATERVSIYPWSDGSAITDQITVDVLQFERGADGNVTLTAFWSIGDMQSGKTAMQRRSTIVKPVVAGTGGKNGTPYDATVAAMSEALADLSKQIAEAIKSLPAG